MRRLVSSFKTLAFLSICFLAPSSAPSSPSPYEKADICDVLGNPTGYVGKRLYFNGLIHMGYGVISVRDPSCRTGAVKLLIGGDVINNDDIKILYRKVMEGGVVAYATVAGSFSVSDGAVWPYTLRVEKVWDVAPLED